MFHFQDLIYEKESLEGEKWQFWKIRSNGQDGRNPRWPPCNFALKWINSFKNKDISLLFFAFDWKSYSAQSYGMILRISEKWVYCEFFSYFIEGQKWLKLIKNTIFRISEIHAVTLLRLWFWTKCKKQNWNNFIFVWVDSIGVFAFGGHLGLIPR